MNDPKTLYISDLDGTLLNSSALLSDAAKSILNRLVARGMHFTVATARTLNSSLQLLEGVDLRLPVALMNGALLYDLNKRYYTRTNALDPAAVIEIIRTLRQFEVTGIMYRMVNGEMRTYHESAESQPVRDFIQQRIARYNIMFTHTEGFTSVPPDNTVYFSLLDTYPQLLPVRDALARLPNTKTTFYEDNYAEGLWYLEVFSPNASKQGAVEYMRKAYGFQRVIGFGDNFNDLPMLYASDVGIAVENAKPEVKAAADLICGGNDEDGVARWLEEHAL